MELYELKQTLEDNLQKLTQLGNSLDLNKLKEEIDEFEEYVKTDDYIKDTAEDKLGLVDPDEIIFKPSN